MENCETCKQPVRLPPSPKSRTRRTPAMLTRAVELMALHGTYLKVAVDLSIAIETLVSWRKKDPEFQAALNQARLDYEGVYVDDLIGTMMERVRYGDVTEESDETGTVVRITRKKTAAAVMDVLERVNPQFHPKASMQHQHTHTHAWVDILKRRQIRDITPKTPPAIDGEREGVSTCLLSPVAAGKPDEGPRALPAVLSEET